MTLDLIFRIILLILIGFEFAFITIPVGTDKTKSKRFPLITLSIVAINVLIFCSSFAEVTRQEIELASTRQKLLAFLEEYNYVLLFEGAQEEIKKTDLFDNGRILTPNHEIILPAPDGESVEKRLGKHQAMELYNRFSSLLYAYNKAIWKSIYHQYGLAPNGRWTFRQLWTHMFLHGSTLHLLGNMIFLLALGCSLEGCWGYGAYAIFYLLVGAAACIPSLMHPADAPMIGASGAISGVMGAFIVSMRRTKIKIAWLSIPFAIFFLMFRKKPFGVARVRAYIFLTFYFISQLTFWWVTQKSGADAGIAYSAHVGGFFFGVFFGVFYEAYRTFKYPEAVIEQITEEEKASPALPAPQSSLSPAVSQSLSLLHRDRVEEAERKLKYQLFRNPGDAEAIKLLIEIYRRSSNHEQMNEMTARLVRHYLSNGDKSSALRAYDNLLRSLPPDQISPRIPARDWMVLCDYLRRQGMNREAAVECERLVKTWPDDPIASRACVTGGEAALSIDDKATAIRLFETALKMNLAPAIEERARRGIAVCSYLSDSNRDGSLLQRQV